MLQTLGEIILEDPNLAVLSISTRPSSNMVFALISDGSVLVLSPSSSGVLTRASKNATLFSNIPNDSLVRSMTDETSNQARVPATSVACHPYLANVAAVGFKDGSFTIWNPADPELSYQEGFHSGEIAIVKWMAHGRILATCDTVGQVVLFSFSPESFELAALTKTRKSGSVINIIERTVCTDNLLCSQSEPTDVSSLMGSGLFECIIGWARGDISVLTDSGTIRHIGTLPIPEPSQSLQNLVYWPSLDAGCALSQGGDFWVFTFENTSVGAYKQIISKSKLDFSSSHGIAVLPGGNIVFMGISTSQVRLFNILTQESSVLDLDEYLSESFNVFSRLIGLGDLGILASLKDTGSYAVISLAKGFGNKETRRVPMAPIAKSTNYLHLNDNCFADEAHDKEHLLENTLLKSTAHDSTEASLLVTEHHCLPLSLPSSISLSLSTSATDFAFYQQEHPSVSLLATSYDPAKCQTSSAKKAFVVTFSLDPKDAVTAASSNANSAVLTRAMMSEALGDPKFLAGPFTEAKNSIVAASLIGVSTIFISVSGPAHKNDEHEVNVAYTVKRISVVTNPGTSAAAGNLSSYVLSYGENRFSVFEVTLGSEPRLVGSFYVSEEDSIVADCQLFGRYIIASQNTKLDPSDVDYQKVELVKYGFTGTRVGTLSLTNDDSASNVSVTRIARLTIVNNHIFLVCNNLNIYYADIKTFSRVLTVTSVYKMLFNTDIFSAALSTGEASEQAATKGQPDTSDVSQTNVASDDLLSVPFEPTQQSTQNAASEPLRLSILKTLPPYIPQDSICIHAINGSGLIDSVSHCSLALTFKGFNVITGSSCILPYVMCLSVNCGELNQLITSSALVSVNNSGDEKNNGSAQEETFDGCILSSRLIDFAPYAVVSAGFDTFDNICVELLLSTSSLPYIGFCSLLALKMGIFNRYSMDASFLHKALVQYGASGPPENHDGEEGNCSQNLNQEVSTYGDIGKLFSLPISMQDRIRAIPLDCNRRLILTMQGIFAPYITPSVEVNAVPVQSTNISVASPYIIMARRGYAADQPVSRNFTVISTTAYPMETLSAKAKDTDKTLQSAEATYALNKFTICVSNGRLSEAYNYVAHSESLEIWKALALLCIKNHFVDLLRTCVSHLKSPMLSLLLRSITSAAPSQTVADVAGNSSLRVNNYTSADQEISALMALGLANIDSGLHTAATNPILYNKLLKDMGLSILALKEGSLAASPTSAGAFHSLVSKSATYSVGNRLFHLGDVQGANWCYNNVLGTRQADDVLSSSASGQEVSYATLLNVNPTVALNSKPSVIRIRKEFSAAGPAAGIALARKLGDKPALFTAARLLEDMTAKESASRQNDGSVNTLCEASRLFMACEAYTHSMQCALKCDNEDMVYTIGCSSKSQRLSLLAAGYFANKYKAMLQHLGGKKKPSEDEQATLQDYIEKSLILYRSADFGAQAIELCLKSHRLKELNALLGELFANVSLDAASESDKAHGFEDDADTTTSKGDSAKEKSEAKKKLSISNELLTRAGSALLSVRQEDYSLDDYNSFIRTGTIALAKAEAYDQALQVIIQGRVQITERIADMLTPESTNDSDNRHVVVTLGKLLHKAGLYAAAVKKFVSVNEFVLALNTLIKAGNTEKVVKFAMISRNKQVFIAAANYLQTQNWRANPSYVKMIVQFYTKAGAYEFLSKFFATCAAEDIAEYHDYPKAREALKEALKFLAQALERLGDRQGNSSNTATPETVEHARERLERERVFYEQNGKFVSAFIHLCELARTSSKDQEGADTLASNAKKLLGAIVQLEGCYCQIGDVLGLLAEFHAVRGERARVATILKEMSKRGADPAKFVNHNVYDEYAAEAGLRLAEAPALEGDDELRNINLNAEASD